jgi:PAS domain S-box-containing protein/putative nucleotidyltransferase with HDIG domain
MANVRGGDAPKDDRLYRSLFDEMLEGFALHEIVCDDQGKPIDYRFIEANPAFERLTGRSRDEIIGRTVRDVLPDTEPEWIERYGQVVLTGEPLQFRMRSASLDRTYDVRAFNSGHGLFATLFIDVTESARAAQSLERDERLYRAVVESSVDGFSMMDRQGTLLGVNDALCRLTGYARAELTGMTIRDLEATESADETTERMARIEEEGSALFDTTLRSRDGTILPVEVNVSYWPIEGGRYFTFFRDLTKRRRAEYLVHARAELLDLDTGMGIDSILRRALDKAELLTGSSIGFFHLVDPDQEHLTLQTWSTNTIATMCTADGAGRHYPVSEAGVWTESLQTRQPAVHNDYEHMEGKKGMPVGHAPVTRELVVPVVRAGMVVALMGVGNKRSDYEPEDIVPVEAMAYMAADIALHSKAQEEFERFFELVPDLVCIVDDDGRFRRVNGQWEHALGYAAGEMVTHRFLDFVHPDDRAAATTQFQAQGDGEYAEGFVNRYLAKDGTYHWLEWSASPLMGEGFVFAVARDVTKSRQSEEALRESESSLRGLFENMVEGLAYCQMIYEDGEPVDWIYLEVNEAFEKQTGIVGATGRRVSEVIPAIKELDPVLFERYSQVALTGEPTRFETFVESLGDWFDLRVYSPQKAHFVAVFDVITERKMAEAEAAEREQRLQALLDNAPYGAHMYELTPDGRLVLTGYNARAVEMLGIDHGPLLGKTLEEAFPGNIGTDMPEAYRSVAREGGTWSREESAYSAGGIAGVFEVYAFSIGTNQVSVFFRDVTETRHAQVDLQRSERRLHETVGSLAGAIRTLKALTACNEALVRAESEQQLLQDICELAVDQGGYMMTWVAYVEHDEARTLRPVARAGTGTDFLDVSHISWGEGPDWDSPPSVAVRTGEPSIMGSIAQDPAASYWKNHALSRGYESVAAFPIKLSDGETIGAIIFVAGEHRPFSDQESALLAEFGQDLSYGIETLRAKESGAAIAQELEHSNESLAGLLRQVTVALGRAVEARDPYTSGHQERVASLARQIASEMGLDEDDAEAVEIAGLVHDIGKLSIPAEILTKPSSLSPIEIRLIRDHSRSGYEILKDISFAWPVADIVLQHHERIDGSGYPNGITGPEMLPLARILAVADVVEAMASHRPYRPALGLDAAIAEITTHPELYDEAAVAACVRLFKAGAIDM